MAHQLPLWVWPTVLLSVCALAAWRGRDDERLAAGGQLANWALTILLVRANAGTTSADTQWGVLAADATLLVLLFWIAMRSRRYWPLFATAFHLLVVVVHFGRMADSRISGWAYLTAGLVFAYLVLLAIGYGAWTARGQGVAHGALANEGGRHSTPS